MPIAGPLTPVGLGAMDNEAKVEQYLLLAKNARGLALVDLIAKATAEPGLFTYGELLARPSVGEVRGARGCHWRHGADLGGHLGCRIC